MSIFDEDYNYEFSSSNNYLLKLDGRLVMQGTLAQVWAWIHSNTSYSVAWALKNEGYSIEPLDVPFINAVEL